jgi:hypothetical protein
MFLQIKMKSNAAITHYTENGIAFADGTEIPADLIVFATGFDLNLSNRVRDFFGKEIAAYFGEFSNMNEEGEASGAYRFYREIFSFHPIEAEALTRSRSWSCMPWWRYWCISLVFPVPRHAYESCFNGPSD